MWSVGPLALLTAVLAGSVTGDVRALLRGVDGWWAYALVFALAAIPLLEVLVVVPPAIGFGLDPLLVGLLAFLGNVLPVYLVVAVHDRVTTWLARRREGAGKSATRSKRATRILDRYGLAGLALAAPVVTGVHLAAVIALLVGASPRHVAGWMTAGIAAWTVVLVVASVVGFGLFGVV